MSTLEGVPAEFCVSFPSQSFLSCLLLPFLPCFLIPSERNSAPLGPVININFSASLKGNGDEGDSFFLSVGRNFRPSCFLTGKTATPLMNDRESSHKRLNQKARRREETKPFSSQQSCRGEVQIEISVAISSPGAGELVRAGQARQSGKAPEEGSALPSQRKSLQFPCLLRLGRSFLFLSSFISPVPAQEHHPHLSLPPSIRSGEEEEVGVIPSC